MHQDSITNTPHKRSHHDSVAQTSLFVDHARNVFIVVHVDDCVVVVSSSHLDEVVREMKQCSTMKVTLTLSLCQCRTDVWVRCTCVAMEHTGRPRHEGCESRGKSCCGMER